VKKCKHYRERNSRFAKTGSQSACICSNDYL